MDKGLLVFIIIGIGGIYFVTNFIDELQHKKDDSSQNISYQYQSVDSLGQIVLDFTDADVATQVAVWNASTLKEEFLDLFPDFSAMKRFIQERVRGDSLQAKLIKHIESIETQYVSGIFSAQQAKEALDLLN